MTEKTENPAVVKAIARAAQDVTEAIRKTVIPNHVIVIIRMQYDSVRGKPSEVGI